MLKIMFTLLVLTSAGLAQYSSDGSFSVRHSKNGNFSLSAVQMREAESLYQNACAVVQHDFHGVARDLHPHFTVVIGTDRNEVHAYHTESHFGDEIWMKKWDPVLFAEGAVVIAFDQLLTRDVIQQLSTRVLRYSGATLDVSGLK